MDIETYGVDIVAVSGELYGPYDRKAEGADAVEHWKDGKRIADYVINGDKYMKYKDVMYAKND